MKQLSNKESIDLFPDDIEEFNLIDKINSVEHKYGRSVFNSYISGSSLPIKLPMKPTILEPSITFPDYPIFAVPPQPISTMPILPTFAPSPSIAWTSSVDSNELAANGVLKIRIDKLLKIVNNDILISLQCPCHSDFSFAINDKDGNGARFSVAYDKEGFIVNNNLKNGSQSISELDRPTSNYFNIGSYSSVGFTRISGSHIGWFSASAFIIISRRFNKIIGVYSGNEKSGYSEFNISNGLNKLCYISLMRTILNGESVSFLNSSTYIRNLSILELISTEDYNEAFFNKLLRRYCNNNYRLD